MATRKNPLELTAKQERFVRLVVEKNYSFVDAYIDAYESTETNKSRLDTAAKRIRNKPAVKAALNASLAQINTELVLWNKEKAIAKLLKVLQKAEDDLEIRGLSKTNTDTILNSIKELNAIAGTYFKDSKKYEIDLANLEISRLRYEMEKMKIEGDPEEEQEDDGFMDAIKAAVTNVWIEEE
ncbi:MAG: hypothetical protein ACRCR2_03645 [Fusobacteriaceae bacterium]